MSKLILFKTENNQIAIVYPCTDEISVLDIGKKDVPPGVSFWIIDSSILPDDREQRDAWTISDDELGEPAGKGGIIKEIE